MNSPPSNPISRISNESHEWMIQGENLMEHQAYGIHVHLVCVLFLSPGFRRHIPNRLRTLEGLRSGWISSDLCYSKISDSRYWPGRWTIKEDVVWLHITMHEVLVDGLRSQSDS